MRAVLTYHSIDDSGSPISVSKSQFAAHVRFLASDAVEVVGLRDIVEGPQPQRPTVAITFDDGFANFETEALPLLQEHGLSCTQFIVTGHVGGSNAWNGIEPAGIPTLPLLDWDGVGRIHEAGVEVGAHTHTHPHLSGCTAADLADEMTKPIGLLEQHLSFRTTVFAYPYGDYDDAALESAASHFDIACTTELDTAEGPQDARLFPRLDMYYFREPGRLEALGTSRFRRYLTLRRTLRGLRSAVFGA